MKVCVETAFAWPNLQSTQTFDFFKKIDAIRFSVEDVPCGYNCTICRERYSTRWERNEHLETHFIHKKCTDCNRLVIIIGDLEFELHRPTYCKAVMKSDCIEPEDMHPFVALERLKDIDTVEALSDKEIKTDTIDESIDTCSDIHLVNSPVNVLLQKVDDGLSDLPDLPDSPKPIRAKRVRKKTVRTVKSDKKPSTDKPTNRIPKTRPVKMITCTQDGCTEEFRRQLLLRKHLKSVHGIVERHLCHICNFSFADKSNLKHHMVTHTDNKRFICSFCGARFHKLTNMTEHMNGHLGLKPYKCEICGKDFGRSNHKRQHMRVMKLWKQ